MLSLSDTQKYSLNLLRSHPGIIRLTYHGQNVDEGRIANATTGGEEIEVTEEMVEAGEDVILCEVGGADLGALFSASDLAKRVYLAMQSVCARPSYTR